ncbi:MAG: type IV pilin protein [Burkholderiaceae bacterium]
MQAMRRDDRPGGARGFTLIELMAVVVIIAILAAIAIPSYTQYVQRANRNEAQQTLLEAAAFLQRCFTQNGDYSCPLPLTQSPPSGAAKYTIAISAGGGAGSTTYTLTATRVGTMAGDECGDLTLKHTGVRGIVNQTAGRTVAECWR